MFQFQSCKEWLRKKKKRGIDLGVAVDTVNVMRDEEGGWEIVEKPKDKENARKQMKRILSGDPYFVINSIAVGPVNDLRGFLSLSVHALPIRIEVEEGQRERLEKEWMRKYEERVLKGRDITPGGISQVDLLVLPHLRVFLSDNGFYLLEKKNETELMGLMEQVEKEEVGEFVSFLEIEEGEKEEIGTVIAGCSKEGMSEAFFNWVRVVQVLGSSEYPVGKKMHKVVDDMMQGSGLSSGVFYR